MKMARRKVKLSPQNTLVLDMLKEGQSLTHLQAIAYGIWSISSRVSELRKAGFKVKSVRKADALGRPYVSYSL